MGEKFKFLNFKFEIFNSILLYYSTIFSTILIIGGFYTARSGKEIIPNLLFLPIVIFIWISLIKHKKNKKLTNHTKYNKLPNRTNKNEK